ncbi:MAG: hypothetical protein AAF264_06565 [Pseudomonadota bacterium]
MIVAGDLQGHWRRAWLKAPGLDDHDTAVHWMQAGKGYADIRIPASRPDTGGARALADLAPNILRDLMRAEGFAGEIVVDKDVCTWARHINWHGATDSVDAGLLTFHEDGALGEAGVHADYEELWHRSVEGPTEAMRLRCGDGRLGVLVSVGTRFVFGIGDPAAPSSAVVADALDRGTRPDALAAFFRGVFVLGRWRQGVGLADLSTNPLLEGRHVLTRTNRGAIWHDVDFFGRSHDRPLDIQDAVAPQSVR